MELVAGMLMGAMIGSAAASVLRVGSSAGVYMNVLLGVVGAVAGGALLCSVFPSPLANVADEVMVWCAAGAVGAIALVAVVNMLEHCLDLDAG